MYRLLRCLLAVLALVVIPLPAAANAAAPWSEGERVGDPSGIRDVVIKREELVIDMRPLAKRGRVAVAASYTLENRTGDKHLELVFASGASDVAGFRVTLDGTPVPSRLDRNAKLPPRWRAPTTTPRLDGDGALAFVVDGNTAPFGFDLDLPSGEHRLAVTYSASPMSHHVGDPTVVFQFAYVLAPAEEWKSFGGLDLTVHVPPGWRAAATPRLTHDGDSLRGSFDALPADAIALTVQPPFARFQLARTAGLLGLAMVTIGGGIAVVRLARRRAERGAQRSVAYAVLLGLAWSSAFVVAALLAIFGPDRTLADGTVSDYGYGRPFVLLLVMLASPLLAIGGAVLAHRRAR